MKDASPLDNRTLREKLHDIIVTLSERDGKTGPFPKRQIEILKALQDAGEEGVENSKLMEGDTRSIAGLISKINERVLGKFGLRIRGEVRYKIVKDDSQES